MFQFVLMQIRPSPYPRVNNMWKAFAAGNLETQKLWLELARDKFPEHF